MFVWRSTYDTRVNDLVRRLKDAETFRLKLRGDLEQLKTVNRLHLKAEGDLRNERDALKSELEKFKVSRADTEFCSIVDTKGIIG